MAQTNDAFDELQVRIRVVYTSLLEFFKEAATAVKAQLKHATRDWQSHVPKLADAQAIAGEALEKAKKEVLESDRSNILPLCGVAKAIMGARTKLIATVVHFKPVDHLACYSFIAPAMC